MYKILSIKNELIALIIQRAIERDLRSHPVLERLNFYRHYGFPLNKKPAASDDRPGTTGVTANYRLYVI